MSRTDLPDGRAAGPARSAGGRQAGRRGRPVPGGRAVLGGFAVAAAIVVVLAAFAAHHGPARATWVVARTRILAGAPVTASELRTAALALGPSGSSAYRQPAAVVGRTLDVTVPAGQLIVASEVGASAGSATPVRPVAVDLAPADLSALAPGDLVDVLVTTDDPARTTVVLRGADVLDTSQPSSGLVGASGSAVVTLGVGNLAEVEALVAAEHAGTLDVVVGTPADGQGLGPAPAGAGSRAG